MARSFRCYPEALRPNLTWPDGLAASTGESNPQCQLGKPHSTAGEDASQVSLAMWSLDEAATKRTDFLAMDHNLVQAAIAAVVLCVAAGCAASAPATATALNPGAEMTYGLAPLKPGTQLGLLDVDLVNRSRLPITLESVEGIGRGLGTVIRVVEVKIAPAHGTGRQDTPGGAYQTDPPVWWVGRGTCIKQRLLPLHGFRLAPGGPARVWIVVQVARPGRFAVTGYFVRYTQEGTLYQQLIPTGYKGLASRTAPFIPVYWAQARCLKSMKPRLLRGQRVHKPLGTARTAMRAQLLH